jgi:hypothetical protein
VLTVLFRGCTAVLLYCRHDSLFKCLELELPWNNYSMPIQSWLDAFPKEQLLLLQYESLTAEDKEAEHLTAVKR